jgi:predicted DNA-binding transcriptional regulator YafY
VRRAARLFALAEHLRARRTGVTAEQLAERFGVTLRTIYRDLDALREAEFPIVAERGRGGGYALDRAYVLPPVNFTAREAALLCGVGRWAIGARLVPFSKTLDRAIEKVRGALAASAQRELLQLLQSLNFIGIPAHPAAPGVREALEEAWFGRRPVRFRYRASDGAVTVRLVRVTGLTMERTMTQVHCDDLDKGEPRHFRLDRIEWAELAAPAQAG